MKTSILKYIKRRLLELIIIMVISAAIVLFVILSFTALSHAETLSQKITGSTFESVGIQAQSIYKKIIVSIGKQTDIVAANIAKEVIKLFGAMFGIWFMYQVVLCVWNKSFEEFIKLLTIKVGLLIIVLGFLNNLKFFNKIIQAPILKTYEMFGGVVLNTNNSNNVIVNLSNKLSGVFDALNSTEGSLFTNFGASLFAIFIMVLLFLLFLQIFLILIGNYFRISLPFAISPILIMFYFFQPLRPIPLKALNIMLDGIIKQGFIFIVVSIMSETYFNVLSEIEASFNIESLILAVIITVVYKDFLKVAENQSSELIGTQSMGMSGGPLTAGMVMLATILTGGITKAYSAFKTGQTLAQSGVAGVQAIAGGIQNWGKNTGGNINTGSQPKEFGKQPAEGADNRATETQTTQGSVAATTNKVTEAESIKTQSTIGDNIKLGGGDSQNNNSNKETGNEKNK